MLKFDQVHFYYKKGQPILDNVTFSIGPGEFVAIVGGNGGGKSTAAKLMNGLLLPRQGKITYEGLDTAQPGDLNRIRERIGYIFQNPEDQFITTTVKDEVLFGLENIRVPREEMENRVHEALRAVGMEEYADAMPHQLSGGQQQRVAIAAVLSMKPGVMIFDEATSMLDPQGREQILSLMQALRHQGMTVIHITHHMEEAIGADRIMLLHGGRLAYDGDPRRFFESMPVEDFGLRQPFAERLRRSLRLGVPLNAEWKEMIRQQWSGN
ncbi:energy-coupling factor transporter ATPase [Paenibacillus sp. DYY-L-2]|uniref:energy-coupling factor transporter ATPase n=1 Tax=Paenibacillus sp. DYY-L-2 TaxID=3447013 RepID=UPI003F503070